MIQKTLDAYVMVQTLVVRRDYIMEQTLGVNGHNPALELYDEQKYNTERHTSHLAMLMIQLQSVVTDALRMSKS